MAISSGFFNSVEGDRKYSANDFGDIFNGIIRDGVFDNVGQMMMVKPGTGVQVVVQPGRAWFNGTWTFIDADTPVNLGAADPTRDRIDAIVLKIDKTVDVRANSLEVIAGSPASSPSKPSIPSSTDVWRYALAFVTVKAAGTSISAENIENCVGTSTCPLVTGALQLADITTIYQGMKEQFDTWFANLKYTLSDDVAGNLQNEIEERVKYTDKATAEDVSNATPSKWIDAEMFNNKLGAENVTSNKFYMATSSTTIYSNKGGLAMFIGCGGGGGGGAGGGTTANKTYGTNGKAGTSANTYCALVYIKPLSNYRLTIGSGGSGGYGRSGQSGDSGSSGGVTTLVEMFGDNNTIFSWSGGSGGAGGQANIGPEYTHYRAMPSCLGAFDDYWMNSSGNAKTTDILPSNGTGGSGGHYGVTTNNDPEPGYNGKPGAGGIVIYSFVN